MDQKCYELEEKARRTPREIDFEELTKLARCFGFILRGEKEGVQLFRHERYADVQRKERLAYLRYNLQEDTALTSLTRQIVDSIDFLQSKYPSEYR